MKESNGKIVIVTDTPEQAEKILKLNKSLKQTGQIRSPKEIKPRMILLNAPSDLSSDAITHTIKLQNRNLKDLGKEDFEPVYKTGKRDLPECHWVINVSPVAKELLLKTNRIYVHNRACKIHDYTNINRCFNCQRYGHRATHCLDTSPTCGHCAVTGHKSEACPSKNSPAKCVNCTRQKKTSNHSVRN